jgi:hypothetical protein
MSNSIKEPLKLFALIGYHDGSESKWTEMIIEATSIDHAWKIVEDHKESGKLSDEPMYGIDWSLVPINAMFQ